MEYICFNDYYELDMLFKHQSIGFSNFKSSQTKNQMIIFKAFRFEYDYFNT